MFIYSHKLKIEMGRFTRPLTSLDQRVCDHCLMTIEDEFHFLMQWPRYSHIRSNFLSYFQKQCKNFPLLNSKLQFNWLLANSDDLVIIYSWPILYMTVLKSMVNEYMYLSM